MEHYDVLFQQSLPWITRYRPERVSVSRPEFHYFTSEQEGYFKVNLAIQEEKDYSNIDMYYQQTDHFSKLAISDTREDHSKLADFSFVQEAEAIPSVVRHRHLESTSLWVEKHTPQNYVSLLTDEYLNRTVLSWVKGWDETVFKKKNSTKSKPSKNFPLFGDKPKVNTLANDEEDESNANAHQLLLLAGPPGCGKTTLARVVAKHCGYNYIEINASDNRSAKALISRLEEMANNESVISNGKPTLIILDEVDGVVETESNGIKEVLHYIETGDIPGETRRTRPVKHHQKDKGKVMSLYIKRPVLFICNDPYTKGLKELRLKARVLNFGRIKTDRLLEALRRICIAQKVTLGNEDLLKIIEINQNDVRSSLSMLQFICRSASEGVSARQAMKRIIWEKKQSVRTLVQFLEDIICRKSTNRSVDYRKILDNIYSIDTTNALLLEGFFMNYRNSKTIYRNSTQLPKLLDLVCDSDRIIQSSFDFNYELNCFLPLPYAFFRANFRNEQSCKIEYPYPFFERLNKEKASRNILDKFLTTVPAGVRAFMNRTAALLEYVPALLKCMPPASTSETDMLNSIKLMVNYGIEFGDSVQNAYNPSLHLLFQKVQDQHQPSKVSNATRLTMVSHYKEVKEDVTQALRQMMFEAEGTTTIRHEIKKDKIKRTTEGIQYRFLQGTGTEITYALSLSYFA